ncbi:pleckstrin homology domain-containing family D member 1-like [Haliotis rubra]|uniref:pleckstrin homology domain-containing family D member 1-like n=1 Tax=Haliotis rubra TaxID=36100 RepID=UPI001EE5C6A5|nr:pleckstrin homology domain-containing family D member 1-like [Haliotis rubra]
MNNMPEISRQPVCDWASRIQIHGTLFKKPFGHQSNKWSKRFFLVKDGFLMYYADNEKKEFTKRTYFNIHPKGIVPLGECEFKTVNDAAHPFCIQISSDEINGQLVLALESDYERSKWIELMEQSRRVTWKNHTLAEEMIRQLENQGLQMMREKQDYFDRLQSEVSALSEERERAEELERINQELEKERQKLEKFTQDIKEEYEKIRDELEETMDTMRMLDDDRQQLSETIETQQDQLQVQTVMARIMMRFAMLHAFTVTISLSACCFRLKENEEKTSQLEEEKQNFSEHAQELQSTIKDLVTQKEITEKELREEIRARLSAETKLQEAERSLKILEHAVAEKTNNIDDEVKEEMTFNVQKLRQFFEDLAAEAKLSADQPIIMKNAVCARKTMARRAKTMKFTNRKRSSSFDSPKGNRPLTMCLKPDDSAKPSSAKPSGIRRSQTSVDRSTRDRLFSDKEPITSDSVLYEEHM